MKSLWQVSKAPPTAPPDDLVYLDAMRTLPRPELERRVRAMAQTAPYGQDTLLCRVLGRYKFLAPIKDFGLAPHLVLDGYWEMWITQYMALTVQEGMYVLDVGANCGYYSVLLADLVGPTGRMAAIEPNPDMALLVRRNLLINGLSPHSEVIEAALMREPAEGVALIVPDGEPKNGYIGGREARAGEHAFQVRTVRGDDVIDPSRRLDFVKLDVEGAELEALESMMGAIERDRPTLLVEFNPGRIDRASAILIELEAAYGEVLELLGTGEIVAASAAQMMQEELPVDRMLIFPRPSEAPVSAP